jgi:hypothetical protein
MIVDIKTDRQTEEEMHATVTDFFCITFCRVVSHLLFEMNYFSCVISHSLSSHSELASVGACAYGAHRAGFSETVMRFAVAHPWITLAAGVVIPSASLIATMVIPKKQVLA